MARKKITVPGEDQQATQAAPPDPAQDDAAAPAPFGPREAAALVEAGQLDVATGLSLAALARRAAAGDDDAAAAALLLRAHQAALTGLPPLHDAPRRLPRANERGAAAFTELLALLRLQEGQLAELQATLAELT